MVGGGEDERWMGALLPVVRARVWSAGWKPKCWYKRNPPPTSLLRRGAFVHVSSALCDVGGNCLSLSLSTSFGLSMGRYIETFSFGGGGGVGMVAVGAWPGVLRVGEGSSVLDTSVIEEEEDKEAF